MGMCKLLLILTILCSQFCEGQTPLHRLLSKKSVTPPSGCINANAAAWIAASGISDTTGLCQFFQGLEDSLSLWTTMSNSGNGAAWLLFGGSDATTKLNIFNPIDDDAHFRLTFVNSPTFSTSGIDWNGTNQYANTHLATSLNGESNMHLSYYSRENTSTSTAIDIGWVTSPGDCYFLSMDLSNSSTAFLAVGDILSVSVASRQGFIAGTCSGTSINLYKNGVSIQSGTRTSGATNSAWNISLGAAASLGYYSNRQCAFASVGGALTADQMRALNFLVEQLMDARGIGVQ